MAGDIRAKERAIVTLTSSGASLTSGSAGAAGTDLDMRAAGNAADDFQATFQLTAQWATITSIAKDTVCAELYVLPKMDGSNLPDIDTTSGASALPYPWLVGLFTAVKAPSANTNMTFVTGVIVLPPRLYTCYILNRSGQTISANWTLKVVTDQAQYT